MDTTDRYVLVGVACGVYIIILIILLFLVCLWIKRRQRKKHRDRFSALVSPPSRTDNDNVYSKGGAVTSSVTTPEVITPEPDVRSDTITVYEELGERSNDADQPEISSADVGGLPTVAEEDIQDEPVYSHPDLVKKHSQRQSEHDDGLPSPSLSDPLTPDLPPRPDNLLDSPLDNPNAPPFPKMQATPIEP